MKLILVRHPAPDVPKGTIYGHLDVPVRPDLMAATVVTWQDVLIDVSHSISVWTSPLSRCRQAAELWCAQTNRAEPKVDARLMEVNFGDWEGRTWDALPPAEVQTWMDNWLTAAPPGGESLLEVLRRVSAWWQARQAEGHDVMLIGHATPIRLLVHFVQKHPLERLFDIQISYGEMIKIG